MKGLIRSMRQMPGSKNPPTISRRKWDLMTIALVPVCIAAVGGMIVFWRTGSGLLLMASVLVFAALSAFLVTLFWKKTGLGYGESDVVVELLKRKTVEMERDRFVKELEEAHRLLQASTDKQRISQDELAREKANKDEAISEREKKIKMEFEAEKEKFINLLKGEEQKKIELEKRMAEQEIAWARKFEDFEAHLRGGTLKDLEAQYDKSRTEIVQDHYAKIETLKRESEEKLRSMEESFRTDIRSRDSNIEELNRRIAALQSEMDNRTISSADKLSEQINKTRALYEVEKEGLLARLHEQEKQFQAQLAVREEQLNIQKIQIISACESFVTELETREKELAKKERQLEETKVGRV